MDINEPSLIEVAHDTINSTQSPSLIEVAYFPLVAKERGRVSDHTLLCLSCSHVRRPEDLSCPGLDRQVCRDLRGTGDGVSIGLFF